jgi:putative hydrolases of HD superfamily
MNILKFASTVGKLKELKRTGWVESNIPDPESVAEHSYRVAMLAMVFAGKLGLKQEKVLKMALIHDLAEAEIGDIVGIRGGVRDEALIQEKAKKERRAMARIFSQIDDGEEYLKLFDEYEANVTPEAQLVKQLDRLESGLQALEYEHKHLQDLEEFFITTKADVSHEALSDVLMKIMKLRPVK